MASSCRRYFIDIEASNNTKAEIAKQVFTGWDFAIAQKGTKDRKQRAALVSLQVSTSSNDLELFKQNNSYVCLNPCLGRKRHKRFPLEKAFVQTIKSMAPGSFESESGLQLEEL